MPPRSRGGEAVSFRRRKKTQIEHVLHRIKHAKQHEISNPLILRHVIEEELQAAQGDSKVLALVRCDSH